MPKAEAAEEKSKRNHSAEAVMEVSDRALSHSPSTSSSSLVGYIADNSASVRTEYW